MKHLETGHGGKPLKHLDLKCLGRELLPNVVRTLSLGEMSHRTSDLDRGVEPLPDQGKAQEEPGSKYPQSLYRLVFQSPASHWPNATEV